ncbi:HIT domain-containing protein [Candidatus Woesearchaeota archaeon]|nr:HIT domain-containing protein [Candidatus Woesearchaeota archaeon]
MPEQQMTPEQVKAMQEKIKQMSPEELKEFQKKQCIFCQIISGKVASKKIYEDEVCIAILDINPANPGHILLMPKEHYQIMPMIPDDELAHLSMVSKALSHAMLKALKAQGTTIFIANGIAAGQRAQHFMLHIIPRKEGDKLPLDIPQTELSSQEMSAIKKAVQERVKAVLKVKEKAVKVEEKEEKAEEKKEEPEKKEETEEKEEVKEKPKPKKKAAKKTAKKAAKKKKAKPKKKKAVKKIEKKEGVSLDDIANLLK